MADQENMTVDEWRVLIDERWENLTLALNDALVVMGKGKLFFPFREQRKRLENIAKICKDMGTKTGLKFNGQVKYAFRRSNIQHFCQVSERYAKDHPDENKSLSAVYSRVCEQVRVKYEELVLAGEGLGFKQRKMTPSESESEFLSRYSFKTLEKRWRLDEDHADFGTIFAILPRPRDCWTSDSRGDNSVAAILELGNGRGDRKFSVIDCGAISRNVDETLLQELDSVISKAVKYPEEIVAGDLRSNSFATNVHMVFEAMKAERPESLPQDGSPPQNTDSVHGPLPARSTQLSTLDVGNCPYVGIALTRLPRFDTSYDSDEMPDPNFPLTEEQRKADRKDRQQRLEANDVQAGSVVFGFNNFGSAGKAQVACVLPDKSSVSPEEFSLKAKEFNGRLETYLAESHIKADSDLSTYLSRPPVTSDSSDAYSLSGEQLWRTFDRLSSCLSATIAPSARTEV